MSRSLFGGGKTEVKGVSSSSLAGESLALLRRTSAEVLTGLTRLAFEQITQRRQLRLARRFRRKRIERYRVLQDRL